jgi:hypothetical protein
LNRHTGALGNSAKMEFGVNRDQWGIEST